MRSNAHFAVIGVVNLFIYSFEIESGIFADSQLQDDTQLPEHINSRNRNTANGDHDTSTNIDHLNTTLNPYINSESMAVHL